MDRSNVEQAFNQIRDYLKEGKLVTTLPENVTQSKPETFTKKIELLWDILYPQRTDFYEGSKSPGQEDHPHTIKFWINQNPRIYFDRYYKSEGMFAYRLDVILEEVGDKNLRSSMLTHQENKYTVFFDSFELDVSKKLILGLPEELYMQVYYYDEDNSNAVLALDMLVEQHLSNLVDHILWNS